MNKLQKSLIAISVASSIAILLGACDSFLTPVNREYTKQTVTITWQEVDNEAQLNAACGVSGEKTKILGCAYSSPALDSCTIFTHKNAALETLGHEFLHCFTGSWHG